MSDATFYFIAGFGCGVAFLATLTAGLIAWKVRQL